MNIFEVDSLYKTYVKPSFSIKNLFLKNKAVHFTKFNRKYALSDINFKIERGSSFAILGHNGSGKSTLLSLLLGTIKPQSGSIITRGKVASLLELGAGFHPELTGRENAKLYSTILGMSASEYNSKKNDIFDFSELGSALDRPLRTYSAGMIARLGFATIANFDSDVILIDEVLAVGDSQFKLKCNRFLKNYTKNGGTLVIVSHELSEVAKICDSGILLSEGFIVDEGPILPLLKKLDFSPNR